MLVVRSQVRHPLPIAETEPGNLTIGGLAGE